MKNQIIERQGETILKLEEQLRLRNRVADNYRDGYEDGLKMAIEVIRKEITQYG